MNKYFIFWIPLLTVTSFAADEAQDALNNSFLDPQTCPFSTSKAQWIWRQAQEKSLTQEERTPFIYLLGCLYFMGNDKENKEILREYHQVSFAFWNDLPLEAWTKILLDDHFYVEEVSQDQKEAINLWEPLKDNCPWSRHMLAFHAEENGQFDRAKALYRQNPKSFYSLVNLSIILDKEDEIFERTETLAKAQNYIEKYAPQVHDVHAEKILAESKKILAIALNSIKDWEKSAQFFKESGDLFKKHDSAEFIKVYESYYDSIKKIFEKDPSIAPVKNLQERTYILKELEDQGYEKKIYNAENVNLHMIFTR